MRTLELNEMAQVSGGLVGAESGSLLCDAAVTRPPGTNAWGEVPTLIDHMSSSWGAITASAQQSLLNMGQFFLDNGLVSWMLRTQSGVGPEGVRTDGEPIGYGCGDASTDRFVPDRIFNVDITDACVRHDRNFDGCMSKAEADLTFKKDVYDLLIKGNVSPALASMTAELYYQGVNLAGQSAYDKACPITKP